MNKVELKKSQNYLKELDKIKGLKEEDKKEILKDFNLLKIKIHKLSSKK